MEISDEFNDGVDVLKRYERKIMNAEQRVEEFKKDLKKTREIKKVKDTDIVTTRQGANGRSWIPKEYDNHANVSGGFYSITSLDGVRPSVVINIKDPLTGKHTTRTRTRENLIDAIIARNELAATLLKEGIIDFEYFLKITQN